MGREVGRNGNLFCMVTRDSGPGCWCIKSYSCMVLEGYIRSSLACWNKSNGCGIVRCISGGMGSWNKWVRIICTNGGFDKY
jgi:hypothetical protein